jgi:hypothetical protein
VTWEHLRISQSHRCTGLYNESLNFQFDGIYSDLLSSLRIEVEDNDDVTSLKLAIFNIDTHITDKMNR